MNDCMRMVSLMATPFDWDATMQQTVQHYVDLCREYPAQVDAWREQTRILMREHECFKGLEDAVRAALKA